MLSPYPLSVRAPVGLNDSAGSDDGAGLPCEGRHVGTGIVRGKERRPRNQDGRARPTGGAGGFGVDSSVDGNAESVAAVALQRNQLFNLAQRLRDQLLAPETGIHGHDEDEVNEW